MSPEMALRVISLQSSAAVAFGGKRTSTGRHDRLARSQMTQLGHWVAADWVRCLTSQLAGQWQNVTLWRAQDALTGAYAATKVHCACRGSCCSGARKVGVLFPGTLGADRERSFAR